MTIENSKLRTDFVCIATSGYAVDGRQITSQELHEMVETYDPQYYTANLWPDHKRWLNFGQVIELKAEEQENGETKLFAVLAPSEQLVSLNKSGQYLFTSIEIVPNFRNSGKCYLFGLGVTDTPASVGTTQLNFSINNIPHNTQFGEFIKCDLTLDNTLSNVEEQAKRGLFNALKEFFSFSAAVERAPEQQTNPENNNNKEDYAMDQKHVDQIVAAVTGLSEKIDKHFSAAESAAAEPAPAPEAKAPGQQKNAAPAVTAEQFNKLQSDFNALQEKFNVLNQEVTPVPSGMPAEAEKFNVAV